MTIKDLLADKGHSSSKSSGDDRSKLPGNKEIMTLRSIYLRQIAGDDMQGVYFSIDSIIWFDILEPPLDAGEKKM